MLLTPVNYDKLNFLPTERKLFVIRAAKLIEETRKKMKEQGVDVSLPYRMQLKADCEEIERIMKTFEKGRVKESRWTKLEHKCAVLQTESENILMWKFDE